MCWMRYGVLCVVAALLALSATTHAITTAVDAGQIFVVEEAVQPGHLLMFRFQLHPDYLLTVTVKDRDTDMILQWWRDEETGEVSIPASDKKHVYRFIFDNANSVLTYKNVNFDIRVVPDPELGIAESQIDPIEKRIRALSTKMYVMKGLQQTLRYQQKDHRATVEDVNERVLLWSILQVVGFVAMCVAQMLMLRYFLERKRTI